MNLIDEKVIEEAAKEYAENAIPDGTGVLKNMFAEVYSEGALFPQQQLHPFIVELMDFVRKDSQSNFEAKSIGLVKDKTTQQLLEEFIEFKNKQK